MCIRYSSNSACQWYKQSNFPNSFKKVQLRKRVNLFKEFFISNITNDIKVLGKTNIVKRLFIKFEYPENRTSFLIHPLIETAK